MDVLIFNLIHYCFYQTYPKSSFAFLVYKVAQVWSVEFIDVKCRAVIDDVKNNGAFIFQMNMQLK